MHHWSQCWLMSINANQFVSILLDVDQWHWWEELISIGQQWSALGGFSDRCLNFYRHWSLIPMLINVDQCQSICLNTSRCRSMTLMRGTDQHWSAMIGIGRFFRSMPEFLSALITFDGYWAMIEGVLKLCHYQTGIGSLSMFHSSR